MHSSSGSNDGVGQQPLPNLDLNPQRGFEQVENLPYASWYSLTRLSHWMVMWVGIFLLCA